MTRAVSVPNVACRTGLLAGGAGTLVAASDFARAAAGLGEPADTEMAVRLPIMRIRDSAGVEDALRGLGYVR